jgi:hypothetical protein
VAAGAIRVGRYVWALPATAVGVLWVVAGLASGGRATRRGGVIEAHGGVIDPLLRRFVPLRGGASAMTLGHVVVGRDPRALERTRAHERAHVRQAERWGPLFIPAYVAASIVAAARGGHYYHDNHFERDAVAAAAAPGDPAGAA